MLLQVITALCCLFKKRKLDDSSLALVKSDSLAPNETGIKSNESESNLKSIKDGPSNENIDIDLVKVYIAKYSSSLQFISKSQFPSIIEQREGNN